MYLTHIVGQYMEQQAAPRPLLSKFSPNGITFLLIAYIVLLCALPFNMLRMLKLHVSRSGERGGHNRLPIFLSPKTLYKSKLFSLFGFLFLGLFSHSCHYNIQ